jgi:hypothetical protein
MQHSSILVTIVLIGLFVFKICSSFRTFDDPWLTTLCTTDEYANLRTLIHRPGYRTHSFIFYHNKTTEYIVKRFAACLGDWVTPTFIPTTKFFESYVYVDTFSKLSPKFLSQYNYILTGTYKNIIQDHGYHFDFVHHFSSSYLENHLHLAYNNRSQCDTLPLEYHPMFYMYRSIKVFHKSQGLKAWSTLLTAMGYKFSVLAKSFQQLAFYRNVYLTKSEFLLPVAENMKTAIELVERNHMNLSSLFSEDSHYTSGSIDVALRVFNTTYYQLHPFIFERFVNFCFARNNARICYNDTLPQWR